MTLKDITNTELMKMLPDNIGGQSSQDDSLKVALLSKEFSADCNGGICRYTLDLCKGLAELGHEVHIITKSKKYNQFTCNNIFVHSLDKSPTRITDICEKLGTSGKNFAYSYLAYLKLIEIIKDHGVQIVEVPLWDAEGFVFSLVKKVPLVVRLETPLYKVAEIQGWNMTIDLKLANWLEGKTIRRASKVIAISRNIGTLIADHHHLSKENIVFCPLGIALPEKEQLNFNRYNEYFDVLFVGRLEKRKGLETLFKAIPSVVESIPNVRFTIIGADTTTAPDGRSYKIYLLSLLKEVYHKYVNFLGFVNSSDLNKYYKNCDIFVAPSLYESFGLIYLEAMSWGKPAVGCNVGGIPEIIQDGESGIIIEPNDEINLYKAILRLNDAKFRKIIGMNARERIESDFSMKEFVNRTISIYRELLRPDYKKWDDIR